METCGPLRTLTIHLGCVWLAVAGGPWQGVDAL